MSDLQEELRLKYEEMLELKLADAQELVEELRKELRNEYELRVKALEEMIA